MTKRALSVFAVSRTGNRGAVSMLESAIDNLVSGENGCTFNVFTVYPRDDAKLQATPGVNLLDGTPVNLALKIIPLCMLYRMLRACGIKLAASAFGTELKALIASDAVLIIGGTTFSDAQPLKILYNVICLLPAIVLGKRSMMYSETLGPFKKWYNRIAGKMFLPRITVVAPRGSESLANVLSLGLRNARYFADSAFTLHVPQETVDRIRERYADMLKGRSVVGISVNSIVEEKCKKLGIDHNGSFAALIRYLREKGYFVLLVPHSMRLKSKLRHNNDLYTVADILELLTSPEGIHVVKEPYDCKELRVVVGLADYYVASRFHSMISALCTNVPVVVFGWGYQKYREVLEEFGLERYCYDGRELSGDNLIRGFEDIVRDGEEIRMKIQNNLPRVRASSALNHTMARRLCSEDGFHLRDEKTSATNE
jgi:colanic acid/amylovoran biosynthesis protein